MMYLVTGTAGFIGFHVAQCLLSRGDTVVGLDIVNDYYDTALKEARLAVLKKRDGFVEARIDLQDRDGLHALFINHKPARVIHLAAQAGVRYSLDHPHAYIESNISGFLNILEVCRHYDCEHLTYASSSSVYGTNEKMPFTVGEPVDHPISLYAASKRANELMAHCYSHLFQFPTTGLRFFTVYGPWGRPDMALFIFAKAILDGEPISLFNEGQMKRDFTYIDDVVRGILNVSDAIPKPLSNKVAATTGNSHSAPFKVYNIGNNKPENLLRYVEILEDCLGRKAEKILLPMQLGDVAATWADIDDTTDDVGFKATTSIEVGIRHFVDWYLEYRGENR